MVDENNGDAIENEGVDAAGLRLEVKFQEEMIHYA